MTTTFKARLARRIADPVFDGQDAKVDRHVLMCNVLDVPRDLPKDANPRQQNIDRRIYKDIAKHLVNDEGEPNTFHLKNKGITILADTVEKIGEHSYRVAMRPGQGVVDGAHTYEIIMANQDTIRQANESLEEGDEGAINQFVKVEILTGLADTLVSEIAGGLNTAVQVQPMALHNLENKFSWIKQDLAQEPYYGEIAFTQNEPGRYDVRDILVILEAFNVTDFPNDGKRYPTRAFNNKEAVLKSFADDDSAYKRLRPLLKDILYLYDTIALEARHKYNEGGGKKGGKLSFMEGPRKNKPFEFLFINREDEYRLFRGALLPMVGAFRWMVVEDPKSKELRWRGSFQDVLELWRDVGQELMEATLEINNELGRKLTALGKSNNLWARLHGIVVSRYLLEKHPSKG